MIHTAIHPAERLALVSASGVVSVAELLAAGIRVLTAPEWENGFRILCDYRAVTEMELTAGQVRVLAEQDIRHKPLIDQSRCAVVAPQDLVFGLTRMWQAWSADSGAVTAVFRDLEEALEWLGMDRLPEGACE